MDQKKALAEIGLGDGEIKVYTALLKLGSSTVSKIKEETGLHRTTIYDFIEKLLNKGLVSYVIKNNTKHYNATDPNKLIDFLEEKEKNIRDILPDLLKLSETKRDDIRVEVYRGIEGLKTYLNDVLRAGKDLIGFGVDETKFKERAPIFMEQYFKKEGKLGIKERLLTKAGASFVFNKKTTIYRVIPQEFFSPTPTLVYGNKVVVIIWEPLTIVMIENTDLARSYKGYFEMLWKSAKPYK